MTPIPQRDADTYGGSSGAKAHDPVAAYKERLREKVKSIKEVADTWPIDSIAKTAILYEYDRFIQTNRRNTMTPQPPTVSDDKLSVATVKFSVWNKKHEFKVIHNMPETQGLSLIDALNSWLARTEDYTPDRFCEYVQSKGFKCYTQIPKP